MEEGKKNKIKRIKAMQMKERRDLSERHKDWKQKVKWEVEVDKMNCKWPWGRITINALLICSTGCA